METKCNLIIDSCCDLPAEVVDREGVYLMKFPYFANTEEYLDDLYQTTTAKEFYDGMRAGAEPHTSQVPVSEIEAAFAWVREQGKPAVYLSFSSGLSGTFNTFELMLAQEKEKYPDLDIQAVDTKLASVAEALLVYEAMLQQEKGLTADEMVAWAQEAHYFVNEQFMVDDLEALRRGGRIPSSVAYAGSKLDVKPLLSIDAEGKLVLSGMARGRKKGIKALVDYYRKRKATDAPGQNMVVGNADCSKDAQRLVELLLKEDDSLLCIESSIGPVIGSHVGPGMLAVVFWGQDKRNDLSMADRIANKVRKGA